MARPDITLRNEKGSSLTFNEMDQNFSSFFYSASALQVDGANKLRLFYTGSNLLDSGFQAGGYTEVLLPTAQQSDSSVSVPGDPTQVIFHGSNGNFDASANLRFTQADGQGSRLGIGIGPTSTLALRSTLTTECTNLRISAATGTGASSKGFLTIDQGGTTIAQLGKIGAGNTQNISFISKAPLSLGYTDFGSDSSNKLRVTNDGVAIGSGISTNALSELSVEGDLTIGGALAATTANYIGSNTVSGTYLPSPPQGVDPNTVGLLLQSPKSTNGGHVVIGINTNNNNCESFSVVKGVQGNFNCSIATFKADGKVGISQINPIEKLHVEGNITGSGNINVIGTGTIQTISELSSLSTDWDGSTEEYARTLVASSTGLVQYMDAAPVPKGGIIMWSGTVDNIPTGWRLCDGTDENGVSVPNLSDRFIVAAGNTSGNPTTNIEGSNKTLGGSTTISRTASCKLGESNIPAHNHAPDPFAYGSNNRGQVCDFKYLSSYVVGDLPSSDISNLRVDGGVTSGNSDNDTDGSQTLRSAKDAEQILAVRRTCLPKIEIQTYGKTSTSQTPIDLGFSISNQVPPYYALAFIIYVGKA